MTRTFKSVLKNAAKHKTVLVFLTVFFAALFMQIFYENLHRYNFNDAIRYLSEDKPEKSLRIFSEILVQNPSDPSARLGLGQAYEAMGSLSQATQQYEESAKAAEEILFKSYLLSGSISERAGNKDEAIRLYQSALKINPRSEEVKNRLKKLGA